MLAGVEAGGTKFVCAVGTPPADLRAVTSFPTTTPAETLGRVTRFVNEQGERFGGLEAVGVASFGPLDLHLGSPTYGHLLSTPKREWRGVDIAGTLTRALGLPVGLDTDVNGAALAEGRWGAARGLDTFVYVTVGTGIGGGGFAGGVVLHGLVHPELGHLRVRRHPDDPFPGRCPFHGDCLEGMASGPAVGERWQRPADDLGPHREAAVALEAWYLAELVAALVLVVSPRRIVLGGGVMKLPGLLDAVRARAAQVLNGYPDVPETQSGIGRLVVTPQLGDRAGVIGALGLAQDAVGERA